MYVILLSADNVRSNADNAARDAGNVIRDAFNETLKTCGVIADRDSGIANGIPASRNACIEMPSAGNDVRYASWKAVSATGETQLPDSETAEVCDGTSSARAGTCCGDRETPDASPAVPIAYGRRRCAVTGV